MPKPRPEADMLRMQHAHVVALLVRQHEAMRLKAERDALANACRESTAPVAPAETVAPAARRAPKVHQPRPA